MFVFVFVFVWGYPLVDYEVLKAKVRFSVIV